MSRPEQVNVVFWREDGTPCLVDGLPVTVLVKPAAPREQIEAALLDTMRRIREQGGV